MVRSAKKKAATIEGRSYRAHNDPDQTKLPKSEGRYFDKAGRCVMVRSAKKKAATIEGISYRAHNDPDQTKLPKSEGRYFDKYRRVKHEQ